jgi:hypothetical protein
MAIEKVIDLQIKSNADQAEKSVGSLKSQLREAQAEVATLSDKFGATSREAIEAAKKAGELKDKIGDAKALTEAFNPDAKFKALSASLSGVAGGFAAVQGGMALFGSQSEDVEKTLLKVQSAMALSQGLQSIGESVDSFKQLGAVLKSTSVVQKVMTATTAAYTFVTEASTAGLKLFRLALIGTGVGALVVGVGLLIANFDKVKKVIMNLIPGLASVGDFIGGIVDSVTDFVGATSDATRAVDKLKKEAETTLSVNKKFMQEHGDQVDEYTKKKIDAKNAYAEAVKEDGANQTELAKRLNRELAEIEYSRGDEKRKIQKEANEKANADKKADNEKAIELEKENQKKYAEETQTGLQLLNQAVLDNEAQIKLDKSNLKDEQLSLLQEGIDAEQEIENTGNANKKLSSDERINIAKAEAQQKKDIQDAEFALASGAINFLKEIGGKNKAIQKAAIIAENAIGIGKMIIANNTANIASLATPQAVLTSGASAVPVIAMNNITTALGVATTIAATAKALSAVGGGSAGGAGATAPKGGGAMGGAPTAPQFNVVGASGTNQIAQAIGGQQQQPVQAYVVAGAVTTGQSLNRNIISNASMG